MDARRSTEMKTVSSSRLTTLPAALVLLASVLIFWGTPSVVGIWFYCSTSAVQYLIVSGLFAAAFCVFAWLVYAKGFPKLIWVCWDSNAVEWGRLTSRRVTRLEWKDVTHVRLALVGVPEQSAHPLWPYDLEIASTGTTLHLNHHEFSYKKIAPLLEAIRQYARCGVEELAATNDEVPPKRHMGRR